MRLFTLRIDVIAVVEVVVLQEEAAEEEVGFTPAAACLDAAHRALRTPPKLTSAISKAAHEMREASQQYHELLFLAMVEENGKIGTFEVEAGFTAVPASLGRLLHAQNMGEFHRHCTKRRAQL